MVPSGKTTLSAAMKTAHRYHGYSFSKIEPYLGNRVVEIGCAWGIYTQMIVGKGRTVLANDIDEECINYCQERFNSSQAAFIHGDIMEGRCKQAVVDFRPDSILIMQVLEHIEDDVGFLRRLADICRSGTRLVLFVPAFQSLYGPMDKEAGHFRRYTRASLSRCVTGSGWRIEKVFFINPIGGAGWWINNRLLRRWTGLNASHINAQITFFDKYVLPASKMLEAFTRNFFGQSLFLIAKLPERG